MTTFTAHADQDATGIYIQGDGDEVARHMASYLHSLGISDCVETVSHPGGLRVGLQQEWAKVWMPASDTTQLAHRLSAHAHAPATNLECEIVVAMLGSPRLLVYPNGAEFRSSVRIRRNIAVAARKTQLTFHTSALERPEDCWTYSEESGFTVLPGRPIAEALRRATQPDDAATQYAFSCYRASEYVMLLGIAQELEVANPSLLATIQARCTRKAIKSAEFHATFLLEHGSMDAPLPANYYVPGDRVWFRNPDPDSSDASGYEGSWVIYLGQGLFSNFWQRDSPYTLRQKCAEIFHWRNATYVDEQGDLRIDELKVTELTARTMASADELDGICQTMARLRDPSGVYGTGGMLDASREFPRCMCPGTADMHVVDDALNAMPLG